MAATENEGQRQNGLTFGYNRDLPDGVRAAFGGRWIVDQNGGVDIVPNRWSHFGTEAEDKALAEWLDGPSPGSDSTPFREARDNASRMLKNRSLLTRERKGVVLYADRKGAIVGNTNASAGYLYVAGWLFEHLPEDAKTKGLEKALEDH